MTDNRTETTIYAENKGTIQKMKKSYINDGTNKYDRMTDLPK